ncbi:hypothetical protein CYY_010505, partial [Polysphondylium violaceum]
MVTQPSFNLLFYDSDTPIATYTISFGAVIQDVKFYESSIEVTGFLFDAYTSVTTNKGISGSPIDNCVITTKSTTSLTCTPVSTYFAGEGMPLFLYTIVTQSNAIETRKRSVLIEILNFNHTEHNADSIFSLSTNIDPINTVISGISDTLYTPTVASNTTLKFTFPSDAQCGYAFISNSSSNFQRITTSMFLCPTPYIQREVIQKPYNTNNNELIFLGRFLNRLQYKSSIPTLTYTIQYGGGTTKTCLPVSQSQDANLIYTIGCQIPAVTNPTTFKLIANTTTGLSSSIYVIYTPTITSITKTDYKVPGVVTMTGTGFTSYNLLITIGGSQCQSLVVQEDGLQLTCEFASDVIVIDFNKPLEVVVSIPDPTGYYADQKSIFYYNRPTPTISQCTSTMYGVPGIVTVSGDNLFSTNVTVIISGKPCTNPVSGQDGNTITCQFESGVTVTDINT